MSKLQAPFTPLNIAILTVSDSRTLAEDTSGQYLVDQLTAAGHQLADRQLIIDDIYKIRAVISGWIADQNVHAIITTGGTGFISETVCQRRLAYCLINRLMVLVKCSA